MEKIPDKSGRTDADNILASGHISMPDKDHIKKLIAIKSDRLQILQEQTAYKGINSNPELLMEIEEIEEEIEKFREQLETQEDDRIVIPPANLPPRIAKLVGRAKEK